MIHTCSREEKEGLGVPDSCIIFPEGCLFVALFVQAHFCHIAWLPEAPFQLAKMRQSSTSPLWAAHTLKNQNSLSFKRQEEPWTVTF